MWAVFLPYFAMRLIRWFFAISPDKPIDHDGAAE